MARGAQRYVRCVQPATQERVYTTYGVRGSDDRIAHLCPRHVGMLDKGQDGIMEARA